MITPDLFSSIYALVVVAIAFAALTAVQFGYVAHQLICRRDKPFFFPAQLAVLCQLMLVVIGCMFFYDVALFAAQQAGWVQ